MQGTEPKTEAQVPPPSLFAARFCLQRVVRPRSPRLAAGHCTSRSFPCTARAASHRCKRLVTRACSPRSWIQAMPKFFPCCSGCSTNSRSWSRRAAFHEAEFRPRRRQRWTLARRQRALAAAREHPQARAALHPVCAGGAACSTAPRRLASAARRLGGNGSRLSAPAPQRTRRVPCPWCTRHSRCAGGPLRQPRSCRGMVTWRTTSWSHTPVGGRRLRAARHGAPAAYHAAR